MVNVELLDPRQFDSRSRKPADPHGTRIAFVQPFLPDGNYLPNLGIMYLASLLLREGYDVRIFDENIQPDALQAMIRFAPELAGFTCVTAAVGRSSRMATALKASLPDCVTLIGGPHMSAVPKETISRHAAFDFGIQGEAEAALLRFCREVLRNGKRDIEVLRAIPGLCFRAPGETILNPPAAFLESGELDDLPFPAWHLLDLERVFRGATHGLFTRGKRIMPVMTTRGCPNYCGFCCRVMGFKFRKQSIRRVLTEIRWLYDEFKIDEIYFEDDTFTQEPERAHELLDGIIALGLPIWVKFANGLRADKVDEALLRKMRAAGVYWIGFGIESGSPHTQALMRKKLDLSLAATNVALAKSLGFKVGSNCIIGYPGETKASVRESLAYFRKLKLHSLAVVTCVPFPGTTAWQVCAQNGWFTSKADDYDNYWFEIFRVAPLIQTPHLSASDLSRAIFWAYVRFFFLSPARMWLVLKLMARKKLASAHELAALRWLRVLRANSFSRAGAK